MPEFLPVTIRQFMCRPQPLSPAVQPHRHNHLQWYCVCNGQMKVTIDGKLFTLRANESILVKPQALRSLNFLKRKPSYLVVLMTDHALGLERLAHRVLTMNEAMMADLRILFEDHRHPAPQDNALFTTVMLNRLMMGFMRQPTIANDARMFTHTAADVAEKVDAYMRRRLDRTPSREELADAIGISASHLARIFKLQTGRSLMRHLTELRIEQARYLLRHSTLTISEIALEMGLSSFSHFSKIFHDHCGQTPSAFRATPQD